MNTAKPLSARRALVVFLLALAGSLVGALAGPHIVAMFAGTPEWALPLLLAASFLLALIAVYVVFRFAASRKRHSARGSEGEA